jgi:hypothetical protein
MSKTEEFDRVLAIDARGICPCPDAAFAPPSEG